MMIYYEFFVNYSVTWQKYKTTSLGKRAGAEDPGAKFYGDSWRRKLY